MNLLRQRRSGMVVCCLLAAGQLCGATEVKISAKALERTLRAQLFSGPEGRYYMKGDRTSACFVYASEPHVWFKEERIVVQVKTRAKLGTSVRGSCLGWG